MNGDILVVIAVVFLNAKPYAAIVWDKIICKSMDENFTHIDLCEIKPDKQKVPAFSLSLHFTSEPVTKCLVNTEFYRVPYKKPLTNRTWDTCQALVDSRRNIPAKFLLNILKRYSNLNHTCPYNHPITVRNLIPPQRILFPVPLGLYNFKMYFILNDVKRVFIDVYFKIT